MEKTYEVGVKYHKQQEDGEFKITTDLFLIDAISFTDAEFRAHEELGHLIKMMGEVVSMKRKQYTAIIEGTEEQLFFEVKTEGIEDGAKVQKGVQLIRGFSMEEAINEIKCELEKEYKICKVVSAKESPIQGYYPPAGVEIKTNLAFKAERLGLSETTINLANKFQKREEETPPPTKRTIKAPEKKTETKKPQRVAK